MYKLAKGWTKKKVLAQIAKYNDGSRAFDKVGGVCTYKAPNGNRCAIGAFIPSQNKKALEFIGGVEALLEEFPTLAKRLPFKDVKALHYFQNAHDNARNISVLEAIKRFLDTCVE